MRFCTHHTGKDSWFLPFNRGWNEGAGNPPNPEGIKTDYLWRKILSRESLANILENYAQVVGDKRSKDRTQDKAEADLAALPPTRRRARTFAPRRRAGRPASGTSSSIPPAAARATPSPGSPTS